MPGSPRPRQPWPGRGNLGTTASKGGPPSLERRLLDLETVPAPDFPGAAARVAGADGLVVFTPGKEGSVVRLAAPPSLVGLRIKAAPGLSPPRGRLETWTEGLGELPAGDRFPGARWAVIGSDPELRFTLVLYGRGRQPGGLVADPDLGRAFLARIGVRLGAGTGVGQGAGTADLLARLSHEFKTPLVSVKGYAELILDQAEDLDSRTREWARRIAAGANRLATLFRKVTAEARTEAPAAYEPRAFHPDHWIPWCVNEIRSLAAGRQLEWDWAVAAGTPSAWVDPEAARDVLLELLQNGARATPDGGRVRVSARAESWNGRAGVQVTVEDTGVGLPGDGAAEQVFDRFVTLSDLLSHHSGEFEFGAAGLGLGLPLVRGVARAHGGEAWGEARGRNPEALPGAAVHLWLPAAPTRTEEQGADVETAGQAVLLLEPDPEARGVLAKALGAVCEVVIADSADAACRLWADRDDWIGCVVEPRLAGGVDLIRDLRRIAGPDGPGVLVYTTAGPGEAQALRAAGADACLEKPVRARMLSSRLQAISRRRSRR